MIEIYVLLTMAIIMFGTTIGIVFLSKKKGTPNMIMWGLFTFSRGILWLIESIADYYDEVLNLNALEPFFDRLEIVTALISSFILLAACLEYNGMIRRHMGKIISLLLSILPLSFVIMIDYETLEELEDTSIIKGDIVSTELFRFSYGFILPLISIIAIIGTFLYYYHQTRKGKIFYNSKMLKITLILVILIFLFLIFEGFEYYEDQDIGILFLGLSAIPLAFFIILPLIIVLYQDLGLQKFLIIEHSGLPLFQYDFMKKTAISDEENVLFLTSGFLSAIVGFSEQLANKESGFLSIQSSYLYYIVRKTKSKLYALQSILYNKKLKNQFFNVADIIDDFTLTINRISKEEITDVKEILDTNFSTFI